MAELDEPGAGASRAAVILSAGASSRFDGAPKALLEVGGEPAVRRILTLCAGAGFPEVLVVVGPHRSEIAPALEGTGATIVENPAWRAGRTGSVQVGLRAVEGTAEVLLWPVDHPFVDERTLGTLLAAAASDPLATWILPAYRGQGGHPVLLKPSAATAVLALSPSAPLRAVLPHLGPQVRRVPVEDPGVLENVDSPQSYWAARAAWQARQERDGGP
jgi:molybdenum cofactor cytidylyltransferase